MKNLLIVILSLFVTVGCLYDNGWEKNDSEIKGTNSEIESSLRNFNKTVLPCESRVIEDASPANCIGIGFSGVTCSEARGIVSCNSNERYWSMHKNGELYSGPEFLGYIIETSEGYSIMDEDGDLAAQCEVSKDIVRVCWNK